MNWVSRVHIKADLLGRRSPIILSRNGGRVTELVTVQCIELVPAPRVCDTTSFSSLILNCAYKGTKVILIGGASKKKISPPTTSSSKAVPYYTEMVNFQPV